MPNDEQQYITPILMDYENWWRGLSHASDFYFHNAIFELIDNSFSSCNPISGSSRPNNPTIEIVLEDSQEDEVKLIINDNGLGIDEFTFRNTLMNPGSKPRNPGRFNEHGFGLKNALSYIQSGNLKDFRIISKSSDGIFELSGPYQERMPFSRVDEDYWNSNVVTDRLRENRVTGTTIVTSVSLNVIKTLTRGSSRKKYPQIFGKLCDILREHIMVTYRKTLFREQNLRIFVVSRSQGQESFEYGNSFFIRSEDRSIKIWNHEYEPVTRRENMIDIRVGGSESHIPIVMGRAPHDSKQPGRKYSGFNYYYQLTNARVGIDIFVRDRLVKAMEWETIWGGAPEYSNNWFVGEIELDEKFPTRNNKTNVDLTSPQWIAFIEQIRHQEINPPNFPNLRDHQDILQLLVERITSGRDDIVGEVKKDETRVFGDATVDLWFEVEQANNEKLVHIYELKIETSSPLDLYQLLMYCDGLLEQQYISPETSIRLHLLAPDHSEGSKACCDYLRRQKDSRDRLYDIWLDKYTPAVEGDRETIQNVRIDQRWYPQQ